MFVKLIDVEIKAVIMIQIVLFISSNKLTSMYILSEKNFMYYELQ